ncbi:hypothetical protein K2173_010927 [Erythroxylum novogranatense]|uniref:AAA+ ATPase domain-containing protein n=1 Tax=Erythroxylum novogranatense TaxID=1862640 RepID=A0AAV8T004_9ROSI|nr:hypothetical protein K2173_010927 [Erythroxylum novogranatense]
MTRFLCRRHQNLRNVTCMPMGKGNRLSSGGRNQRLLRYRIQSVPKECSHPDDIVHYLRERHHDYRRMEHRNFTRQVHLILQSKSKTEDGDDDEEQLDVQHRTRKKQKRLNEGEERLLRIEDDYSRRIACNRASTSSDSNSDSESPPSSSAISTSEDGIFGQKVEPKFDLMRSLLRESYASPTAKSSKEEKNIELDVATKSKTENKVSMLNVRPKSEEVRRLGDEVTKVKSQVSNATMEVKGKEGPRFRDFGGMEVVLEDLVVEVLVPLYHPHVPQRLGVNPISGILLHGPPGCGKTKLAHAIANEAGVPFYKLSATEIVSGVSGASEENIRDLFSKAYRSAPSIVFIDEIDAIASKRENLQREMERRIVTQLMTCMDEYHRLSQPVVANSHQGLVDKKPGHVLVIGATNRPDAIDPALRRPGRFDREIQLSAPDENARKAILSVLTQNCTLEGSIDLLQIARSTPGFVGADLAALVNKAGNIAMRRMIALRKLELCTESKSTEFSEEWYKVPWLPEEIEKLAINMADFEEAAKLVQPSSKREGFSTIPDVKWEDVGGLDYIRKELDLHIVGRIKYAEDYQKFGLKSETGILLYGPPGCGKTLIAKAVANEAGANFIYIKGPELLDKYVGESELAVRTLFSRARTCSPCILFFDEVDALTTKRGREGGWVVERLLNQLLIELDGADKRMGVIVVGATNRPEVMDPAVLRPGRFGKLLYVPLPSSHDRGLILKALAKKKPIDLSVDLSAIGQMEGCQNLSGADLMKLMEEAATTALEEFKSKTCSDGTSQTIRTTHFERALSKVSPSVSDKQIQYYKTWSESYRLS